MLHLHATADYILELTNSEEEVLYLNLEAREQ